MIIKLAYRNIWRNRRRTLITAASVFFAVLLAIFMKSIQKGAWENMQKSVISYYYGYLQIQGSEFRETPSIDNTIVIDSGLMQQISSYDNVVNITPRLESFALASLGNATKGSLILGIDPEKEMKMNKVHDRLVSGHFLKNIEANEVVIAEGLQKYLDASLGDTLVLIGQGFRGSNAAGKYEIVGTVKLGAPELNNQVLYLPLVTAQNLFGVSDRVSSAVLSLRKKNEDQVLKLEMEISQALDTSRYDVLSWQELMPELVQARSVDEAGSKLILYILYILIGFGIFGTVIMMIKERQYEFGVMVSIGMKRWQLSLIIWLEVLMMGLIGTLVGMIFSIPLVLYFQSFPIRFSGRMMEAYERFGLVPELPAILDFQIFLSQAWVVALIVSAISLYPIYKISHLKPMEAMRDN